MTVSLPSPPTLPGFKVEKLLGTGGMGSVYYAVDEKLQRAVALKVIHSTKLIDEQLEEARAQAKVSHPNIAQIYDIVEHNGVVALVIEYVAGQSLFKYMREKQLSLSDRLNILHQVAKGLTEIHSQNIIHRDIKPDNILVTASGQVKIIDFGIAQRDISPSTRQKFGQQIWLAPEVIQGKPSSIESDIYSFGLLAVFLLLENPINNFEPNLKTLSSLNDETSPLPTGLLGWLKSLTQEKPQHRPRTMLQVGQVAEYWYITLVQQESGQVLTAPITEPLPNAPTNHWSFNKLTRATILKISAVIILLSITGLLVKETLSRYQQIATEYVAIMPISYEYDNLTQVQQLNLKAAIQDTIHNTINENEHTFLISANEVKDALDSTSLSQLGQSPQNTTQSALAKIASNTGSSLILDTNVECSVVSCLITFYQYQLNHEAQKWQLENSQSVTVSLSRLNDLAVGLIKTLSRLLPSSEASYITQITQISDAAFETYIQLSEHYDKTKTLSKAHFQQIANLIAQYPDFVPAYYLYVQGIATLTGNQLDVSYEIEEYARITKRAPLALKSNGQFIESQVRYLLYSGAKQSEAEAYVESISSHLGTARYYSLKAYIASFFNAFEEAIKYYKLGLELRYSVANLIGLATMYWYTDNIQQARVVLEDVTARDAYDYLSNEMLAKIYLYQGEHAKALSVYQRLLTIKGAVIDYNDVSIAHLLDKNYTKSLEYALKSTELSPENKTYLLTLAELRELTGEKLEAQRLYRKIIDNNFNPDDITDILSIALAHAHLGNGIEAIKMIRIAQTMAKESGSVALSAAFVYAIIGEANSAMVSIEQAINSGVGENWLSLSWFASLCSNARFKELNDSFHLAHDCQ